MQITRPLKRTEYFSLALVIVYAGVRLIMASWQQLSFDEAYYWTWSQHIDYWYYDQGPMIAWLLHIATMFTSSVLTVKLVAVACTSVFLYFGNRFVTEIANPRAGLFWLIIIMSTPLSLIGGGISTYDTPMLMFWSSACYFGYLAFKTEKPIFWISAGTLAALGVLSKLPTLALPVGILLTCLLTADGRKKLANPYPWIAGIIALLPLVLLKYWDDHHHNLFTLHSASLSQRHTDAPFGRWTGDLIGGQVLVLGPTTFFAMIWALFRKPDATNKMTYLYMAMLCLPLIFVCLALSTKSKLEVNWPIAAYFTGTMPLAIWMSMSHRPHFFIALLTIPGWIISVIAGFPGGLKYVGAKIKPITAVKLYEPYGWDTTKTRLEIPANAILNRGGFVASTNYRMTAMTAWMLGTTDNVECLFAHTRHNQFVLWTKLEQRNGQDALLVLDDVDIKDLDYLHRYFDSIEEVENPIIISAPIVVGPIRTIRLFECKNFHSYKIKGEAIGY